MRGAAMLPSFDALRVLLGLALALETLGSTARAGVLLVDPTVNANAAFEAAVAAATDGDTLVLLPGDYMQVGGWIDATIVGKGLTIVPAAGARPSLVALRVEDLPAGSQFVLRGVDVVDVTTPFGISIGRGLVLDDCAGAVWVEDCTLEAGDVLPDGIFGASYPGRSGLEASGCSAVTLVRCSLLGGPGAPEWSDEFGHYAFATRGGHGANVLSSKAVFHECTLQGGVGGLGELSAAGGAEGGAGLNVVDGTALLAGSTATGGAKAPLSKEPGDGVHVAGAGSSVWLRGSSATAGSGTPAAQDVDAPPGAVDSFAAPPRSLEASSPLHEGEAGTLVIGGQSGDLTAVFVSFKGAAQFLPGKQGAFVLGSPLFGPLLLAVNPSPTGEWTLPFTIASLNPASLTEQTFLLQLVVHDGSQVLLEGGTALTLLDAAVP